LAAAARWALRYSGHGAPCTAGADPASRAPVPGLRPSEARVERPRRGTHRGPARGHPARVHPEAVARARAVRDRAPTTHRPRRRPSRRRLRAVPGMATLVPRARPGLHRRPATRALIARRLRRIRTRADRAAARRPTRLPAATAVPGRRTVGLARGQAASERTRRRSRRPPASGLGRGLPPRESHGSDRKSTRLNTSHVAISYAVVCLKKTTAS